MSLVELLNLKKDEDPSLSGLDSYNISSNLHNESLAFNFSPNHTLKLVDAGNRTCHWDPAPFLYTKMPFHQTYNFSSPFHPHTFS